MPSYFAVVDEETPRGRLWTRLFGRPWVEVESPCPVPIFDSSSEVLVNKVLGYKVKVSALDPEQLGRVLEQLTVLWVGSTAEVLAEVLDPEYGLPFKAEGVVIGTDPAQEMARLKHQGERQAS